MDHPLALSLQQKNVQTFKQLQCMIMSVQMQQAIHLLQAPVMELLPLIDVEVEQNPLLEYFEENNEDLEREEEEVREVILDNDLLPEIELNFNEHDLEVLRRLDEDFYNHLSDGDIERSQKSMAKDKLHSFLEESIIDSPSLFQQLMEQAREMFQTPRECELAEILIGNFNHFGFLVDSLVDISILYDCAIDELEKVLVTIQTFSPIGVGARNLQESLLIQLRAHGERETLAYEIVERHFDDFLHNRIPNIKKALKCAVSDVTESIKCIAKLDLHPGIQAATNEIAYIVPDVSLREEDDRLVITVNEDTLPQLRINRKYLTMLDNEDVDIETKNFIRQKIISAKWLSRNLFERSDTLYKITESLVKRQSDFFLNPNGELVPLTMKTIAEELQLNESTIARAVSNKYIETPRGLLTLRSFFTASLQSNDGNEISTNTAKYMVKELIATEDLNRPLSDEAISSLLKLKGITCARRTVTKYRSALNIGSAQQRRKFGD